MRLQLISPDNTEGNQSNLLLRTVFFKNVSSVADDGGIAGKNESRFLVPARGLINKD